MAAGPHAEIIAPYFQHMRLLLVEGLVLGDLSVDTIRRVTAKELYQSNITSFPPPKVIFKYDVDSSVERLVLTQENRKLWSVDCGVWSVECGVWSMSVD